MRIPTARHPQVFKAILEGPFSQYGIHIELNKKIRTGTIYKILSSLQKRGYIRTYQPLDPEKKGKLEKDLWGPTIEGIVRICTTDGKLLNNVESIFTKWLPYMEFLDELNLHGFDMSLAKNQPLKAKEIFQKYIQFFVDIRKQSKDYYENYTSYDMTIHDKIGEMLLLQRRPELMKIFWELCMYMPGKQKTVRAMFEILGIEYQKLIRLINDKN